MNGLRKGTFIECGAYDGETASNTLSLEREYGWSGYLIEPNPNLYGYVIRKNRNVTSLNACISTDSKEILVNVLAAGQGSKITDQGAGAFRVPCFTFSSIMSAFKLQSIDYFSLDVEGFELDVLKTIPYDKYDIKTLSVEYAHSPGGKKPIVDFMQSNGYTVFDDIVFNDPKRRLFVGDLIFLKS